MGKYKQLLRLRQSRVAFKDPKIFPMSGTHFYQKLNQQWENGDFSLFFFFIRIKTFSVKYDVLLLYLPLYFPLSPLSRQRGKISLIKNATVFSETTSRIFMPFFAKVIIFVTYIWSHTNIIHFFLFSHKPHIFRHHIHPIILYQGLVIK